MTFLKKIVFYSLLIFSSLHSRQIGTTQPRIPTQKPATQLPKQPVTPIQQIPQKPITSPKTFDDYITQIRTQWKHNDVINAQGIFTDKFIDFVLLAHLDELFTRTLLEAGRSLYLPLSANNEENIEKILTTNAAIENIMFAYGKPFYDPKTKIFRQSYLDELVAKLDPTATSNATITTFTNNTLASLQELWNLTREIDTALLLPQAQQQINATFEKYGFIKPVIQPVVPSDIPKPKSVILQQPILPQQHVSISTIKKTQSKEPFENFIQRLIDQNQKQIHSLLFDVQANKHIFSIKPDNENLAKQLINALVENMRTEYPDITNSELTKIAPAIQKSKWFAIISDFTGLTQFIFDTIWPSKPSKPQQPIVKPTQSPSSISLKIGTTLITIVKGDILEQQVDAIVNAANEDLSHGAGVARAISDAAGPQLQAYCDTMPLLMPIVDPSSPQNVRQVKCPTGQAVITPAFDLEQKGIKNIIHTAGPLGNNPNREKLLASSYQNSLQIALDNNLKSIAFPAISTAIFGYNIDKATPIAFAAIRDFVKQHPQAFEEIRLVLLPDKIDPDKNFNVYKKWMGELTK